MTALLIKSLAALLITASLVLFLGGQKSEYAFILSLACGGVVMIVLTGELLPQINSLRTTLDGIPGVSYFSLALKALGISYLSGFVADTCRDFGQSSLAGKAEFAGKCAIFVLCVPAAINVLEAALKLQK